MTVIEEHAEGVAKWLMESGKVPEAKMLGWLRTAEGTVGRELLSKDVETATPEVRMQEMVEAWSYLSQANVMGRVPESALPRAVKRFFAAFRQFVHAALQVAADLFQRARTEGRVDPEFAYWLDVAAGINDEFQQENLNREMEAELERESMAGLPEIQTTIAGELPHPDTPGVLFKGELRAIYDGIANNPESGASQSARTRTANAFFRPLGESVDLDDVRQRANDKGFDFTTPAEMLEAVDLSVNFGKAQYGFVSGAESFSIGGIDSRGQTYQEYFQQRVIAAQDFVDGKRGLKVNPDGSLTLFHGTSKANEEQIRQGRSFNEGAFFSIRKSGTEYGDSPMDVAKRKHGKNGVVMEIRIDARSIENAAAGSEVIAPGRLILGEDGIWTSTPFEQSSPAASGESMGITLPTDPLLTAIANRITLPEKRAEVFQKMRERVREVKSRFEASRLSSEFNTDEKFDKVRFEQARDLAVLEAVARSLPPELRGKLTGSFRKVSDLRTTKARGEYIQSLIPKIEAALEKHLATTFRLAIRREMERGAVKVSEARTRGGKIGGAGHAIFEQAKKAMTLTAKEAETLADSITEQIEAGGAMTMEQLEELDGKRAALELFQDYENADSVRLEEALSLLQGVYAEGRKEWLEVLMGRRMLREDRVAKLREGLGLSVTDDTGSKRAVHIARGDRTRAKRTGEGTGSALSETIMAAMLSGSQKIRRLGELTDDPAVRAITEQMEQAFATAENVEADRNAADNRALADALRSIFKVSTEYGLAKKLRELSDSSKDAPVDTIEGFREEDVKVPKAIVDSLIRRESSGFKDPAGNRIELDEMDLAALEKAWEQFQELDDKKQASRKLVTFRRRTAKGERKGLGPLSMLEGLQLWLTMRQPDQGTKLEAMGYDATTRQQLEAWLPADVQALGLWMVDHIGKDAFTTDTLHRMEKGVGLPLVDQYFPVRNNVSRSDNSGLALDGQAAQQSGRNVSFIKERVQNQAEPAIVNALAVFLAHRAQSNFWLSHVTALREWGGVLRDESFADAVRTRMGEKYFASLQQLLKRIEAGGSLAAGQISDFERVVKRLMKGFSQGTLGLRVSTLLVNTTAALNATFEIPADTLLRGMMEVTKRPAAFADAWKSPAIQRRIRDGATFEATLAKSSGPSKIPLLALLESIGEKGVAPINYIDTGANTIAAAAVWEHTRTQAVRAGLSEEAAKAAADQKVEVVLRRTAQPTSRLSRSEIEQRALDNPLAALMALFISEPRKNFALTYMAGRELLTGKGTYGKAMAAQQLAMGLVVFAAAEFTVRSFYAAWANAKDDEEDAVWERFKARMLDPKAWGYKLTTGHLTGVPFFGQGWGAAMAGVFDQPVFDSSPNPLFRGVEVVPKLATALGKDDDEGSNPEARERVDGAITAAQGLGSILPGGALVAQLGNLADFGEGVIETEAETLARYKARFRKFEKDLPKAGDDKAIQEQNRRLRADWLKGEIAPLDPAKRKAVLDLIDPPDSIRALITDH